MTLMTLPSISAYFLRNLFQNTRNFIINIPVPIALVLRKLQVATPTKSFLIRGILLTYVLHFKATYYAFIVLLFFDVRVRGLR